MTPVFESTTAYPHELRVASARHVLANKRNPVAVRQRALAWLAIHTPMLTYDREGNALDPASDATSALVASRLAVQVPKSMKARPDAVRAAVRRLHWT